MKNKMSWYSRIVVDDIQ